MSEQPAHVPGAVVRITEVVGSSPNSFSDAVRNAVSAAAETVRGIRGVDVVSSSADVDGNGNPVPLQGQLQDCLHRGAVGISKRHGRTTGTRARLGAGGVGRPELSRSQ